MENLFANKKTWIFIAGLFLLIAITVAAVFLANRQPRNNNQNQTDGGFKVETKQVDSFIVPKGLPAKLPAEPGSKVLQNYESTSPDGHTQSTRIVTSYEKPRSALEVYIKFFKGLGYEGEYDASLSKEGGAQLARLGKGNEIITIIASPYLDKAVNKEITQVEVTLTYR